MATFRYDTTQHWYKGNTHIHSTGSDGGLDFAQLSQRYAGAGYDFLFRTDHWVFSAVARDTAAYPLQWFDGTELDGRDETGALFHIVCLGTFQGIPGGLPLLQAVEAARAQGGLIILAHPHWTGNTQADGLRHAFDGVEIYNHVTQWMNGKGNAFAFWDFLLTQHPGMLAFASDDAHITPDDPGWNGGWVMVNAPALNQSSILDALRRGNYYSTMGPEFYSIEGDGGQVAVKTSPVQFIRLVGPAHHGETRLSLEGNGLTEATFRIPSGWQTAHLQLEDDQRRTAWSNTILI
jgi:hypothetical protein